MNKKHNEGFSLIELIIVVAIMAVLVAIIAPNLTKYLSSSKEKADKSNADTIRKTIEQACALTNTEVSEPQNLNTWVVLEEDSAYYDSDGQDVNGYTGFGRYVADVLEEVPKAKTTDGYFKVKITGDNSTGYSVEVEVN